MIERNDISKSDLQLKPLFYRLLKTSEYILIVAGQEPLVVSDNFFQAIRHKQYFNDFTDSEKEIFLEADFFCKAIDSALYILPQDTIGISAMLKKVFLCIAEILSIIVIIYAFSANPSLASIKRITFEIPILQMLINRTS